MSLSYQVISKDHMTKGLSNIMGGIPSLQITSLPTLVAIGTLVVILCCHVISQDFVIEGVLWY